MSEKSENNEEKMKKEDNKSLKQDTITLNNSLGRKRLKN